MFPVKGGAPMRDLITVLVVLFGTCVPQWLHASDAEPRPAAKKKPAEDRLVPLNPKGTLLLDRVGKRVLLKAKIVQREALLEFFCCLSQTLEHESILSVDAKAFEVHAALLSIGAKSGKPVEFQPKFKPPTGQVIDVYVQWRDKKNKLRRVRGQEWVQTSTNRFFAAKLKKLPADLKIPADSELRYDDVVKELLWFGPMSKSQKKKLLTWSRDKDYQQAINEFYRRSQPKPMKADWVFAGSMLVKDEVDGKEFYLAEDGQLISVANFPSATIDIAMQSSDSKESLLFEAATKKIPPLGTEVLIELIPKQTKKGDQKKKGQSTPAAPADKSKQRNLRKK